MQRQDPRLGNLWLVAGVDHAVTIDEALRGVLDIVLNRHQLDRSGRAPMLN